MIQKLVIFPWKKLKRFRFASTIVHMKKNKSGAIYSIGARGYSDTILKEVMFSEGTISIILFMVYPSAYLLCEHQ